MRHLSSLLLLLSIIVSAHGQQAFDEKMNSLYKRTVPLIKASQLKEKSNVILLDTRSPEEFKVSHIAGAQMIDYDNFKMTDVESIDKNAEVIVYCSVGYRSERIGERLQKIGFTNVKNLYGGIFDWKNQDLEVLNKNEQSTDSVHTYNRAWSKWLYKGIKVYD